MKEQRNTKEGGDRDEKDSRDIKTNNKATDDARGPEKTQEEKRKQRLVLKSGSKPATRITLKGKNTDGPTKPSQTKPQRSPGGAIGSTITRSPHTTLRSRAGNSSHGNRDGIPDFSSYSGRWPPHITYHPNKLRELEDMRFEARRKAPGPRARAAAAAAADVSNGQRVRADKGKTRAQTTQASPTGVFRQSGHDTNTSSPTLDLRENDEAQFELLSKTSRISGSDSSLVKVVSDRGSSVEKEAYDWELVGYPRPTIPTPVSVGPANGSIQTQPKALELMRRNEPPFESVEDHPSPTVVEAATMHQWLSKTTSSSKLDEGMEKAQLEENNGQKFESHSRSILTQSNQNKHHRAKSQDSVKSVRFDPSILAIGPKISTATSIEVKQAEAAPESKNRLKKSLRAFTDTVKDLKKRDRRVLAELLEALRNVESDDDSNDSSGSSEIVGEQQANPQPSSNVVQPISTAEEEIIRQDVKWNDIISKAVATKDQKSYRDALAAGLVQSAAVTKQESRERSKSASSEHTLVGSDDTCIKFNTTLGLGATKRLNPRAPVFRGFTETKQRATQSDPVDEVQPFISGTRQGHRSCDDSFGPQAEVHVAAKVEKYVPPALRGERNTSASEQKLSEPIWVKVLPDHNPKKLAVQDRKYRETLPIIQPIEHGEVPTSLTFEQAELDKQYQIEWFSQWLHDAAKPDHGLGTGHTAELQRLLQDTQACKASYEQAIEDVSLSTQVHEHNNAAFANEHLSPLPYINWAQSTQNLVQQSDMASGYPHWPYPIVGPLIPIPPPSYLFGHLQEPSLLQLPQPLIPSSVGGTQVARKRFPNEDKPGRTAHSLDPAWRDQILSRFASKFPMTGKCQASFPVPPIQDLGTKPAQIQQKLELLILQQKEKKAFEERFKGKSHKNPNESMPSISSESENLIGFE